MGQKIGLFLKEKRMKAGVSQSDLAQHLGLKSAQSISNIERGVAPLPAKLMAKIAKKLEVEIDELIDLLVEETRSKLENMVHGRPKKAKSA